ncbi:MAG TPA: DUF4403 family protein [Longimicrobiaceae bacterium]|nr:DUF4403 family protein [Longimicrobiaceae bacterium]
MRPGHFSAAAVLVLAACGTRVDVPAPEADVPSRPLPQPPPSVIHLPVTLEVGAVVRKVERLVPRRQSREDEWHSLGRVPVLGTLYVKEMWERDPLEVSIAGDRVDVSTRVRYRARIAERACAPVVGCRWVQLAWCGQEGPMPSLRVGLRTRVDWKRDWRIEPRTSARPVEVGERCRLTRARVDVTDRVRSAVQGLLDSIAPQVNAEVRRAVALRPRIEDVWNTLQEPIPAGKGVYLLFRPESVAVARPSVRGTRLSTTVAVTTRPRVVVGERPPADSVPLPNFSPAVRREGGFQVTLVAELPYEAANRLLGEALVGKEYAFRGRRVRVREVHLYPVGDRLALRVKVGGDARGTLYFVGTPRFDPAGQTVTVPDLDFSVETRSVLGRTAAWLLQERLRDQVRGAARFAVGSRVVEIRDDVNTAMNRDLGRSVRLSGRVESLHPLGVAVTRRGIAALVEAEGEARVDIRIR